MPDEEKLSDSVLERFKKMKQEGESGVEFTPQQEEVLRAVQAEVSTSFSPMRARLEVKGKDPKYHYRNVINDPDVISQREQLGYEVVTEDREDGATAGDVGQPDNRRIIAGRYVLMRTPRELYDARKELKRKVNKRALHAPRESFKTKAMKSGVKTEDTTKIHRGPMTETIHEEVM